MAKGPENTFIHFVHRNLPDKENLYRMKNHNQYNGGIADCWYSAKKDLWVEYKWLHRIPDSPNVDIGMTDLQKEWCEGRHDEGRNVWVVLGTPQGVAVFRNKRWKKKISGDALRGLLIPKQDYVVELSIYLTGTYVPPEKPTKGRNRVERCV